MTSVIGAAFVALAALVSALLYRHRGRPYAAGKTASPTSAASFRGVYRYIQVTTVAAGIGSFLSEHWLLLELYELPWLEVAGVTIAAVGLLAFVCSKRALGAEYSPCFDAHLPHRVVRAGPYRWVRHPIYTANLALLAGLALATGSVWLIVNVLWTWLHYSRSAREEEVALRAEFPDYDRYAAGTGRFLPRLTGVAKRSSGSDSSAAAG